MTDSNSRKKGENFLSRQHVLLFVSADLLNLIDRVDRYTDKSLKSTKTDKL